ncbi:MULTISPECIES: hypothetical protein [Rhizobium]|nr:MULTISPECIES: hypothetical protein [Rhizobium]
MPDGDNMFRVYQDADQTLNTGFNIRTMVVSGDDAEFFGFAH